MKEERRKEGYREERNKVFMNEKKERNKERNKERWT